MYVGRVCVGVLGVLRGGGIRYVLEHTIFVTAGTVDRSWHLEVCPKPICTWAYFNKISRRAVSTSAVRPVIASLPWTRRANTATESQCSTGHHLDMRWSPSSSLRSTVSSSI